MSSDIGEEIHTAPPPENEITIEDFVAYLPTHSYLFVPCREPWIGKGVDARIPPIPVLKKNGQPKLVNGERVYIRATKWLDQNRAVEQLAWCPGEPRLIHDRLVVDGGWIERQGVQIFNLYRPPRIKLGNAKQAEPWVTHLRKIYPDDADHCLHWFAHRVQRPGEKINHGVVLGGSPGIGKDTLLEPLKHAVGPWNFHDVTPTHLLASFNSYCKSVILRINEARDLGEINRFSFYDRTKIYTAAPPDVLRVNEKHVREYYVFNVIGFVITTNHKIDGIYLPADDRRHYVAWSALKKEDFKPEYWTTLWHWYQDEGGFEHVAAYLSELDISGFDPKAPPPRTPAFWDMVNAGRAPEDAELADVLDKIGEEQNAPNERPDAVTLADLIAHATGGTAEWLIDRRNRRALPHRMERCGYVSVQNPDATDGLWKFKAGRRVIYARVELAPPERLTAAKALLEEDRDQ
jgi:hypothetical protein